MFQGTRYSLEKIPDRYAMDVCQTFSYDWMKMAVNLRLSQIGCQGWHLNF